MNWFRLSSPPAPLPTGCTGSSQPFRKMVGPSALHKPAVMANLTNGKLVHLDGLNHAWMLERITAGLAKDDDCHPALMITSAVCVSGYRAHLRPRRTPIRCSMAQFESEQ